MNTRISAGVIKLFILIISVQCLCAPAQAKDTDRTAEYMAEIASIEHFNEVQRASDMPGMTVPTYVEWLKTKVAEESITFTPKTTAADEPTKQDRMRQWLNFGINTPDEKPSSHQELTLARRERLWTMTAQLLKTHAAEMEQARASIKQSGFAEQGKTKDGEVMGLIGLQDGLPLYNISYNAGAADTISVDELWPGGLSGLSVTGSNTVMGMWDGGDVLTTHLEFSSGATSRAIDMDGASSLPVDFHPTAVAGTMAAGGIGYSSAKGMAFLSLVWTYDWNDDMLTEMNSAYANSIRVSNHSYGRQAGWGSIVLNDGSTTNCWWGDLSLSGTESYLFGRYDALCTNIDAIVYGNPLSLPVWAAGNERDDSAPASGTQYVTFTNGTPIWNTASRPHDYAKAGYDTITDRGLAKNLLTVGAVSKIVGGYSGTGTVAMATFSSWGPTDDGRIKPDVVAAGVDIFTPIRHPAYPSAPNYYITTSGTSFSAPSVAGAVGLLVDLRTRLAPQYPYLASTLKGLLIHTADEAATLGPDYKTGWGLVNADTAAELVQADSDAGGKQFIKEVTLLDGDYVEYSVRATGETPLKTTICWTDPVGAVQPLKLNPTNLVLVNDLDLRIISPNGSTNFPWILNPANPSNSATKGDNYRDNVEQVVVTNAVADEQFIVRITHKGTLVDDAGQPSFQDVTIVATGIEPESRVNLAIAESSFASDSEIVLWPSVVGQNYRVQATVDLLDQAWSNVSAEISATKTNTTWESELPPPGIHQFYRLIKTN